MIDEKYVEIKIKNFKSELDAIELWNKEGDKVRFEDYIDYLIVGLKKFKKKYN